MPWSFLHAGSQPSLPEAAFVGGAAVAVTTGRGDVHRVLVAARILTSVSYLNEAREDLATEIRDNRLARGQYDGLSGGYVACAFVERQLLCRTRRGLGICTGTARPSSKVARSLAALVRGALGACLQLDRCRETRMDSPSSVSCATVVGLCGPHTCQGSAANAITGTNSPKAESVRGCRAAGGMGFRGTIRDAI